ncbi:MAG: phosphoenolpyruvate--protein phosphotransferase [Candidatus Marinimicrobia bacterium]|nr:phosphoenolpyruvate--protein phosphotransferase [Candidatus Neomarinimicrobiota bacterium]
MKTIKGVKISRGVVSGPIYHFEKGHLTVPRHFIRKEDFESELDRLTVAIQSAKDELTQVRDLVMDHLDEDHARIIDAQVLAVQDDEMIKAVKDLMCREKKNIAWAYYEVMNEYEKLLLKTDSEFFKERSADLRDIKKRVLHHLLGDKDLIHSEITEPSIVVTEKISPGDLIHLDQSLALGLITRYGGFDSHAGILARAFRVPYLSDIHSIEELVSYSEIILDADNEEVLLDITDSVKMRYQARIREFQKYRKQMISDKVANSTKDKVPYHIYLNAGFVDEVMAMNPKLIQGIGLFRTEYLCIERNAIPDEETQFQAYKSVLTKMGKLPVVFRVFDFGRDKLLAMLDMEIIQEDHVFDEWGGIGFLLENPEILKNQLRALLRASVYGNAQIMLPLVMFTDEVRQTLKLLDEIKSELREAGIPFSENIELGAMIETSSVLDELDELGKIVDFFSIGTNDLALYLIGSGRTVDLARNYYHPKMFRAINQVVIAGEKAKIPVNICGEMASDPYALIGLTAIGIRSISVSTSSLDLISKQVSSMDTSHLEHLDELILSDDSAASIFSILTQYHHDFLDQGE